MNNKTALAFLVGAATGAVVTWNLLKTKYERLAQEEIDSVKDSFMRNHDNVESEDENDEEPEPINEIDDKPDLAVYTKKLKEQGYLQNDGIKDEEGDEEMSKPVVISPEEYGEEDDYDLYSYVYYADKVLADENNEPIKNVDEIVGEESLNHFGEYGDDSVYVRNDERMAYYEILLDEAKYSELFPREEEE
jgi:hypothetical protein